MSKSITIVSLNLWRFYDWEKRLPEIVKQLKEINPDIICLQEVQKNIDLDQRNQVEILNTELKYPHINFSVADIKKIQKGIPLKYPVDHGLGILSQFPFTAEIIPLTKASDDKEKRIVLKCDVDINSKTYTITNLHFSNSDIWSENHFKETLSILESKNVESILVGDFNIKDLSNYKELYSQKYISSGDLYKYISYPKDNTSFDYVLLPKKYNFENFSCKDEYVSDHKMIVAKILLS